MYFFQCKPPCKFQFKFSYCCGLNITAGEWTMSGQDDHLYHLYHGKIAGVIASNIRPTKYLT